MSAKPPVIVVNGVPTQQRPTSKARPVGSLLVRLSDGTYGTAGVWQESGTSGWTIHGDSGWRCVADSLAGKATLWMADPVPAGQSMPDPEAHADLARIACTGLWGNDLPHVDAARPETDPRRQVTPQAQAPAPPTKEETLRAAVEVLRNSGLSSPEAERLARRRLGLPDDGGVFAHRDAFRDLTPGRSDASEAFRYATAQSGRLGQAAAQVPPVMPPQHFNSRGSPVPLSERDGASVGPPPKPCTPEELRAASDAAADEIGRLP